MKTTITIVAVALAAMATGTLAAADEPSDYPPTPPTTLAPMEPPPATMPDVELGVPPLPLVIWPGTPPYRDEPTTPTTQPPELVEIDDTTMPPPVTGTPDPAPITLPHTR